MGKGLRTVFGAVLKEIYDQCRTLEKTELSDLAFRVRDGLSTWIG
jgi:hypothetical protein